MSVFVLGQSLGARAEQQCLTSQPGLEKQRAGLALEGYRFENRACVDLCPLPSG